MAAGILPAPGTQFGPCNPEPCAHRDCDLTRRMAATPCVFCRQPIGYDRRFYREEGCTDSLLLLSHATCAEADAERR